MTSRYISVHHTWEDLKKGRTALFIKATDIQVGDTIECWAGDFTVTVIEPYTHPTIGEGVSLQGRGSVGGRIGMTVFKNETCYVKEEKHEASLLA